MKKNLMFLGLVLLTIAVVAVVYQLNATNTNPEQEPAHPVAATIFPVYDITKNITEGVLDVELILPANASPHTFSPSPGTVRALESTDVIYAVGYGLDDWATTLVPSRQTDIVQVDMGIEIRMTEDDHDEEGHEDEHEEEEDHDGHAHGPNDPHYWLSIPNAEQIATNIANDLSERYPEHSDTFTENLDAYLVTLEEADREIRTILQDLSNRNIVTFHDAWYYFSDTYRLNLVGSFEPTAGREPTPGYLAELSEALETANTRTIYSEPQFSTSKLEAFLQDNNLQVAELDPIGGGTGKESYTQLMIQNATTIAQNN